MHSLFKTPGTQPSETSSKEDSELAPLCKTFSARHELRLHQGGEKAPSNVDVCDKEDPEHDLEWRNSW